MRLFTRFLPIWILLAVLLLFGGYWLYWNRLADGLAAGAEAWVGARRDQGQKAAYDHIEIRGFPYRVTLEIDRPRIGGRTGDLAWRWQAEFLSAYFQPWNLNHAIFVTEGAQTVAWRRGDRRGQVRLTARDTRASLVTDPAGRVLRYALDIQNGGADIAGVGQAAFDRLQLTGRNNTGENQARPAGSFDFGARADGVTLPPGWPMALGQAVKLVRFVARLDPPVPASPARQDIARWRDDGGVVEVSGLEITWGPLAVVGEGSLTLDGKMRPAGAFSTRLKGHDATLDALNRAGLLSSGAALTAKAALGLLSKHDQDGEPYVPAPVTAQGGRLYLGPVPILPLAPIL